MFLFAHPNASWDTALPLLASSHQNNRSFYIYIYIVINTQRRYSLKTILFCTKRESLHWLQSLNVSQLGHFFLERINKETTTTQLWLLQFQTSHDSFCFKTHLFQAVNVVAQHFSYKTRTWTILISAVNVDKSKWLNIPPKLPQFFS